MKLVGENKLHKFAAKHANARPAIKNWLGIVRRADWRSLIDVKATFASADYVKNKIVFNVGGNNYRLVAVAEYSEGTLFIREVMTHAEYDRWKA